MVMSFNSSLEECIDVEINTISTAATTIAPCITRLINF